MGTLALDGPIIIDLDDDEERRAGGDAEDEYADSGDGMFDDEAGSGSAKHRTIQELRGMRRLVWERL